MASGRTISASFLTELDSQVIDLCEAISNIIMDEIIDDENKKIYSGLYGKVSHSRDGGLGLAGGKLQRDALCTRGRGGKAPFSNRNLRWHPLVVAEMIPDFAKPILRIEISGEDNNQVLVFVIKDDNGTEIKYPSDKVHEMPARYAALPEHWFPHLSVLKHWSDTLWTQNSCVIPALEACNWWDAVETYATLAIAVAVGIFNADFERLYSLITTLLKDQVIDKRQALPSHVFPSDRLHIISCPVCRRTISKGLEDFRKLERVSTWQPAWRSSKKNEGEDSSIQIMHVNPLIEGHIKHNASNVRYGHRWCNVAMTDHSLQETLDFMEYVIRAHHRVR